MTLVLDLQPELEKRLADAAQSQSMPVEQYALHVLDCHVSSEERKSRALAVLQTWADNGQRPLQDEGGDILVLLDEDRLSDRKLFPPELQGVTW